MKRLATATILGIILVGSLASIAAIKGESPSRIPDLEGKTVIISPALPPIENVTLCAIGERKFIVVPVKRDDGLSFDLWEPLESVSSLIVFDNMEDAVKYGNKHFGVDDSFWGSDREQLARIQAELDALREKLADPNHPAIRELEKQAEKLKKASEN